MKRSDRLAAIVQALDAVRAQFDGDDEDVLVESCPYCQDGVVVMEHDDVGEAAHAALNLITVARSIVAAASTFESAA